MLFEVVFGFKVESVYKVAFGILTLSLVLFSLVIIVGVVVKVEFVTKTETVSDIELVIGFVVGIFEKFALVTEIVFVVTVGSLKLTRNVGKSGLVSSNIIEDVRVAVVSVFMPLPSFSDVFVIPAVLIISLIVVVSSIP